MILAELVVHGILSLDNTKESNKNMRFEQKMLNTLEKRAQHLSKRIASSDKDLSYDKAELRALSWAIVILEDHYGIEAHGEDA